MRKVIVALLMVGLMASSASAVVVKLFKLSGSATAYAGAPRTGLPTTAYVAIDASGNGNIVWYWTAGAVRYRSDVLNYEVGIEGSLNNLQDNYTDVYQDVVVGGVLTQEKYADWDMVGTGVGSSLIPNSLSGVIYSEVYDSFSGEYLGFGYGTCRAFAYKTLSGATDNALSAMTAIALDLQAWGYTLLEGTARLYQVR